MGQTRQKQITQNNERESEQCCKAGLHNSESSKGQIINKNLPQDAKVYIISMWKFPCSMEDNVERQLLTRGRAFATFSTIEKALAGRKKSFRRPNVVQARCKVFKHLLSII